MTLPLADIGEYAITECSVSKLNIILPDGSTMPVDFGVPLNGSDLVKVIDAVRKGVAAEKMSSTGLKNKLLMSQYIYTRNETIEKKFKTAIVKFAQILIDEKNADEFKVLASTGLIDERKLVKIEDYAKNRKNIAKIKDIITELRNSLDGAKETAPKKAAKTSKKAADTPTDVFNIQSGRLKGLSGNDFKEIILTDNVTNIDKGAFLSVKVKKLLLSGSLKKLTGQVFKDCTGLAEVVISEGTESIGKEAFRGCTSLKGQHIDIKTTSVNILNFIHKGKTYTIDILEAKDMLDYAPFDFITSRLFPRKKEATLNLINGIVDIIIKGDIKSYTNYCYEALGEVCYSDGYENTTKVEPLLDLRKQLSEIYYPLLQNILKCDIM